MTKKNDLKVLKFPNNVAQLERQGEAILFAAEEPLDIESIQEKLIWTWRLSIYSWLLG